MGGDTGGVLVTEGAMVGIAGAAVSVFGGVSLDVALGSCSVGVSVAGAAGVSDGNTLAIGVEVSVGTAASVGVLTGGDVLVGMPVGALVGAPVGVLTGRGVSVGVDVFVAGGRSPIPLSEMLCGLSAALSLTLKLATRLPVSMGAKLTSIVQLIPDPKLILAQVSDSTKSFRMVPVIITEAIVSVIVSVLVSVTVWVALCVPTT